MRRHGSEAAILKFIETFAIGAAAGLAVFAWSALHAQAQVRALIDLQANGPGWFDALAAAWLSGQAAVFVHHVLPAMIRD